MKNRTKSPPNQMSAKLNPFDTTGTAGTAAAEDGA